ncbi:hypothetical protein MTP99_019764 [Tenebrio molitor]|nr:hypothetical protein MTP99_019764 [Tenebrio molitor]
MSGRSCQSRDLSGGGEEKSRWRAMSLLTPSVLTTGTGVTFARNLPIFMCARLRAEAPKGGRDWPARKSGRRCRERVRVYKRGATAARTPVDSTSFPLGSQ